MFYALLLLILLPFNAWANIGTIVVQRGNSVQIQRGNDTLPGGVNAGVNQNDAVVTGLSSLEIKFQDDTDVKVTENSRFVIDEFVYDPNRGAGRLNVRVAMGTVRYVSGQIARTNQQNVRVQTPTAVIGVRGTDFFMTVDESGRSLVVLVPSCNAQGNCYTGQITVTNDAGTVDINQPFMATFVAQTSSPPTPPVQLNISISDINNNLIIVRPPAIIAIIQETQNQQQQQEVPQQTATQQVIPTESRRLRRIPNPGELIITEEGLTINASRDSAAHRANVNMRGGNTRVTIIHDGSVATETVGSGTNTVIINQRR